MAREPVILLRHVEATLIPQGEAALLPEGTWLVLQQSLGGSFTQLARVIALSVPAVQDVSATSPER